MSYIFLALYIISSTIHLYASIKCNDHLRGVTKGWFLLELIAFYLCIVEEPNILLILALIFSWLGDVFLIGKGVKWFTVGGICFMASHVFFILTYNAYIDFTQVPIWFIAGLFTIDFIAVFFIFRKLAQHLPKPLVVPMFFYLLINGLMNCFAWYHVYSSFSIGALITAIGALCFFISDSTLFFVRFNKQARIKNHFLVMLTYLAAELFIVVGLCL